MVDHAGVYEAQTSRDPAIAKAFIRLDYQQVDDGAAIPQAMPMC